MSKLQKQTKGDKRKIKKIIKKKKSESESDFEPLNETISSDEIQQGDQLSSDSFIQQSSESQQKKYMSKTANKKNRSQQDEFKPSKRKSRVSKTEQKTKKNISKSTQKLAKSKKLDNNESDEDNDQKESSFYNKKLPPWASKEHLRDKNQRRPDDPDYDPSSLFIPEQVFQKLQGLQLQYWKAKQNHFDKIVFFKFWKFYEVYFEDAIKCKEVLGVNYHRQTCMIYELKAQDAIDKLVQAGFQVAMCEHDETNEEMFERVGGTRQARVVRREVKSIWTMAQIESNNDSFIMSAYKSYDNQYNYQCILINLLNNQLFIRDNLNEQDLKTLIVQSNPKEIILNKENIKDSMIFQQMYFRTHIHYIRDKDIPFENILNRIQGFNRDFKKIYETQNVDVQSAIQYLIRYLDQILILNETLSNFELKTYNIQQNFMELNYQTLQNLDIFEANLEEINSLFGYINYTASNGGKRLLRRWLQQPLIQLKQINERQSAVTDMIQFKTQRIQFQQSIKTLPDVEQIANKLFKEAVVLENSNKVMIKQNLQAKMNNICNFLCDLSKLLESLDIIRQVQKDLKSKMIKKLITKQDDIIVDMIKQFKECIDIGQGNCFKKGFDEKYDKLVQDGEKLEERKQQYIQNLKERFKTSAICLNKGRVNLEVQFPEDISNKQSFPAEFSFSGKVKGYRRFTTKETLDFELTQETNNQQLKEKFLGMIKDLYTQFYRFHKGIQVFLYVIYELDCICSLARLQDEMKLNKPELKDVKKAYINITNAVHPTLQCLQKDFIPNNFSFKKENNFVILTGPNMGGKSTIMRTISLIVILAQIGSYVPCEQCSLSITDKIFTRIGAYDNLMESKSTFYVELEETKTILDEATQHSLVIIDELGRGTSAVQGYIIAKAIINRLLNYNKCKTIFSTHFLDLVKEQEFQQLDFQFMNYQVDQGEIQFFYKLIKGSADKSFAINVAKKVGIRKGILDRAQKYSENM